MRLLRVKYPVGANNDSSAEPLHVHQRQIDRIEALVGTTPEHFDRYYLPPLRRIAEYGRAGSSAARRIQPGHILERTLTVAATALKLRLGYVLPPGAPPETAGHRRDLWTYAVFGASVIHGIAWIEAGEPAPADEYAFRILGEEGADWLSSDREAYAQWCAVVRGDLSEAGVLGEILDRACHRLNLPPLSAPEPVSDTVTAKTEPGQDVGRIATVSGGNDDRNDSRSPGSIEKAASAVSASGKITNKELGRRFLAWLSEGVQSGEFEGNAPDALVRMVPEGMLLVSPGIFRKFSECAASYGMEAPDWEKVQKGFLKLGLHQRTSDGLNMYRIEIADSGRKGRSAGVLIDPEVLLHRIIL
ncbi:conjugal transfer nickase/helicase domain-containing protein [Methylohalobius crimeensis]|uniref:conjugal transfer nickase/helicase domain-containing protein n=1 Tax=Methylohalobius crimeensis TaxID=244365 RepID=UPI000415DB77|nr:DNA-binding domain-containing protein [Methylohalobius crimeensis]